MLSGKCTLANTSANNYLLKHVINAQTSTINGRPLIVSHCLFFSKIFVCKPSSIFPWTIVHGPAPWTMVHGRWSMDHGLWLVHGPSWTAWSTFVLFLYYWPEFGLDNYITGPNSGDQICAHYRSKFGRSNMGSKSTILHLHQVSSKFVTALPAIAKKTVVWK